MNENKEVIENKKGLKLPMMIIGIIVVLLIGAIAIVMLNKGSSKKDEPKIPRDAIVNSDGKAFFGYENKFISISGDAKEGMMTEDGKHYVILNKDGDLFLSDEKGENKKSIADGVSELESVRNNGIVYSKQEDVEPTTDEIIQQLVDDYPNKDSSITFTSINRLFKEYYTSQTVEDAKNMYTLIIKKAYNSDKTADRIFRYTFADEESIDLGLGTYSIAYNTFNVVFEDSENIYTLTEDTAELVKLANPDLGGVIKLLGVSDDGKTVAWSELLGNVKTIYISEDSVKSKIGEMDFGNSYLSAIDAKYSYLHADFFNNNSEVAIYCSNQSKLFWKRKGQDVVTIDMGGEIDITGVMTAHGSIYKDNNTEELYVVAKSDKDDFLNMYYTDITGEKEKVLSNVLYVCNINDGTVYYIDADGALKCAELNKKEILDATKISSDVYKYSVRVSPDNKIVYFGKNYDKTSDEYSLYVYEPSKEPEKIASNVSEFSASEDGKLVSYFTNTSEITGTDFKYGDLYAKKMGKDAAKVAGDVAYLLYELQHTRISNNGMNFYKYNSKGDDGSILVDYYFYNWKESEKLISDVMIAK